jgi:hypothetical protein
MITVSGSCERFSIAPDQPDGPSATSRAAAPNRVALIDAYDRPSKSPESHSGLTYVHRYVRLKFNLPRLVDVDFSRAQIKGQALSRVVADSRFDIGCHPAAGHTGKVAVNPGHAAGNLQIE